MANLCESCGSAHELGAHSEFEDELELEGHGEFEDELELEDEGELEDEFEFEDELEDEAGLEGEGWLGAIGNVVGSLLGEQEFEDELEDEGEYEDEGEFEAELSPIRKIYPDAMMEHLGALAAESEFEDEAVEHFLPLIGMAASKLLPIAAKALAPMAKKALPRIAKAVTKVTPHLTRGVGKIARGLHRQPGARPLLRAVPAIARRTVHSIARQAAHGRAVTPRTAVRTLAKQTRHVLANPRHRGHALRRHRHVERKFHGGIGRRMVRPHWRYRRIGGRLVRAPHAAGRVRVPGTVMRGVRRYGAPGAVRGTSARGVVRRVGRPGRIVSGQCVCPACPTCGAVAAPGVAQAASPAYCRCCGQVLR
jgi:hypothetical protein